MKVDFMIIGAQKCGTTTLYDILNSHPSINGCVKKEPHFFSTSKNWKEYLQDYHDKFKEIKDGGLNFEASTSYTFYPLWNLCIWNDIYEYNPNMKLIYLVRNPIDRIVSCYMHAYERGYTDRCIEEAIVKDRFYIDLTRYHTQIYPYIQKFGLKNVQIIDFKDFISQRKTVIEEISEFLSVDFDKFSDYEQKKRNISVGGYKKHHKFDSPSIKLKAIKRFLPPLWDKITDNSRRAFSSKPLLNKEIKIMIIRMLKLEIIAMEKIMKKDLGKWMLVEK